MTDTADTTENSSSNPSCVVSKVSVISVFPSCSMTRLLSMAKIYSTREGKVF